MQKLKLLIKIITKENVVILREDNNYIIYSNIDNSLLRDLANSFFKKVYNLT